MVKHLLVFGPGYAAMPLMKRAAKAGWLVTASYRRQESKDQLQQLGFQTVAADAGELNPAKPVSHILVSVAPGEDGDPILQNWNSWLRQQISLDSVHYFSSTNVYGDHNGDWVDEDTAPNPSLARGKRRLLAERAWLGLAADMRWRCFIYRLGGIYGPGRNSFEALKAGRARRILKPGQFFGRIHQADIKAAVWCALGSGHKGGTFNLVDDQPSPPQEVVEAAAAMLGMEAPVAEPLADADMTPMARSFYSENKRVKNNKIKTALNFQLKYPSYKEGLAAIFSEMNH